MRSKKALTGIVVPLALLALGWMALAGPTPGGATPGLDGLTPVSLHTREADFSWRGSVERGRHVEIKNVNGGVRAEATGGSEVEIEATANGRDAGELTFEVLEHGDGVTMCVVYPTPDGADRPNECRPGSGGRMSTRDFHAEAEVTVRIPRGVNFVGKTVNGDVGARRMAGNVVARTVNGDVEVSAEGHARAETVNGSIDVAMGRADWSGTTRFETVNGGIDVAFPADLSADVEVSTVNGSIETDFPLTIRGKWGPREARGTIGDGGRTLALETVNGSIRIRKR